MPIYSPTGNLDITNATLRTSNIETQNIKINNVAISAAHNLQQVTSIGNATTNTIEFNNSTTSLTTVSNVTVGNNLTVSGNIISNQETTLAGNVTVGKNILLSSNTTTRVDSNVVVEHFGPHKRHPITPVLKKFPDVDFTQGKFDYNDSTRTYAQAGYVVSASSQSSGSEVWRLFDDGEWDQEAIDKYPASTFQYNPTSNPNALGGVDGEWFKVEFPRKVIIDKIILNAGDAPNPGPKTFKVLGSDNDADWQVVKEVTVSYSTSAPYKTTVESVSSTAFRYYAVVITQLIAATRVSIREVEFYGYEEDPPAGDTSLDTTFTSVMNTPQTGGVKVYVDGPTLENKITAGPTPTSTGATYDSTGKYWSITSNISVEANTFMSGDQPHSVSMWFNSSNLEANTANTCVFSISDQEKLDSVNLDLQSNTWHNLTYAYQGEGGSRVTYLDGRKVAEDQAEDTFGDYPPFAMTGYSQGGYVVSASSDLNANYEAWEIFNNTDVQLWICDDYNSDGTTPRYTSGLTSSGGGVYQGPISTSSTPISGSGSETIRGEYIQIEFPFKFKLEDIAYQREATFWGYNRLPHSGSIVACNDGINWKTIHNWTGLTDADVGSTDGSNLAVTQSPFRSGIFAVDKDSATYDAYKFFRIICTRIQKTDTSGDEPNGYGLWSIVQLELYGHRENDLVRLPDPNRVLKYPHIAMTGPAQRGYVVSSSTIENALYPPWKVFNGNSNTGSGSGSASWVSKGDAFTNGTSNSNHGFDFGSGQVNGPWLRLDMPHKLKLDHVDVYRRDGGGYDQYPKSGYIYGYDGTTWHLLKTFTNITQPSVLNATTIPIDSNIPVSSIVMLITERYDGTTTTNQFVIIKQLEYFGTGVDSTPIQIGGGNIDRVANFRVYDKFIGEDQALEIWDAQKDTFRGVKNSMTLHKGRLGIGTTEPEGRLAVLDEPNGLEEFPPRAMTAEETYMEGHGVFKASSEWNRNSDYEPFAAFNKYTNDINAIVSQDRMWWSSIDTFTGNPGVFNGDTSKNIGGYTGVGLKLELPYSILCSRIDLYPRNPYNAPPYSQNPRAFKFIASKDNEIWDLLHEETNFVDVGGTAHPFYINTTQYYKYFAIVVTGVAGNTTLVSIVDLQFFGTREQGQSVLHDGQLTLTKSLTVPRIGPALDADDTPRRDRLVVEYNTSTNPTFEGAVRDTSGRGNDGFMVGSSYSASNKALDLTNSPSATSSAATSYITRTSLGNTESGNFHHSVSLWFKLSSAPSSVWRAIFEIGPHPRANTKDIGLYVTSDSSNWLGFASGGSTLYGGGAPTGVGVGTYYHIVIVYDGAKKYIYVNGTLSNSGTYSSFNGARNMTLQIGRNNHGNANEGIDGSISNFKMYVGHALTAEEIKTLYDMGRNGSVANPQPLHIAAPLYAPGVPIQIVSKVYKKQAVYNASNSDRNIKELDISIKPKFANSRILLHWMINGELHQDNVIRVARDGSYIIHGYNETQGTNQWSGIAAGAYDQNESSTPQNYCIDTYDEPGGTNTYTYQIYIGSSSTGNYPAYINRTYTYAGADAYEAGICFMSATEIAQ